MVVVGAGYASIACCSPSLMRLDVSANRLAVVDVPSLRGLDRLDQLQSSLLVVIETAVLVSRPLETEILRSWSWS